MRLKLAAIALLLVFSSLSIGTPVSLRFTEADASLITVGGGPGSGPIDLPAAAGTNEARIDAVLSGYTIPFTTTYPADPTTTSSQTVTPANVSSHIGTNGAELTFSSGNYGGVTMSAQDQRWIIQSGANLQGVTVNSTAARIVVEGETARAGNLGLVSFANSTSMSDILFYEVNANVSTTNSAHNLHGNRVALIRSYFASDSYGIFSGADVGTNDIIVAGSLIQPLSDGNNDHLTRWYSAERLVFVANRVESPNSTSSHLGFRFYVDGASGQAVSDGAYVADNDFIYGNGNFGHHLRKYTSFSSSGLPEVQNFHFVNNRTYDPGSGGWANVGDSDDVTDTTYEGFTMTGNEGHGGGSWPSALRGGWTFSGNTTDVYSGNEPPAWSYP